mgnify:CR=1 FL=1
MLFSVLTALALTGVSHQSWGVPTHVRIVCLAVYFLTMVTCMWMGLHHRKLARQLAEALVWPMHLLLYGPNDGARIWSKEIMVGVMLTIVLLVYFWLSVPNK